MKLSMPSSSAPEFPEYMSKIAPDLSSERLQEVLDIILKRMATKKFNEPLILDNKPMTHLTVRYFESVINKGRNDKGELVDFNLNYLSFGMNPVNQKVISQIAEILNLNSLTIKTISLHNNNIHSYFFEMFFSFLKLGTFPVLKSININQIHQLSVNAIKTISSALQSSTSLQSIERPTELIMNTPEETNAWESVDKQLDYNTQFPIAKYSLPILAIIAQGFSINLIRICIDYLLGVDDLRICRPLYLNNEDDKLVAEIRKVESGSKTSNIQDEELEDIQKKGTSTIQIGLRDQGIFNEHALQKRPTASELTEQKFII